MPLKIFVADDSVTIQKIVTLAFSDENAIVESVSNGDIALDSLRRFQPDAVLVDVFMPGCNGYEICSRIKEDPELAPIPVILLIGTFEPFDESEASRVKSDACLTKPFDTSELIQTVHSLVEKRNAAAKSGDTGEPSLMNNQTNAASELDANRAAARFFISPRVRDSFMGSGRILDLFDSEAASAAEAGDADGTVSTSATKPAGPAGAKPVDSSAKISEDMLNLIVDRVMRRMSTEVIREVAWEVVPELSESIIRHTIEEQNRS